MALDPRFNIVSNCERKPGAGADTFAQRRQRGIANNKREFFDALGNVGNLEILNDIGFGEIGEGLRTLSEVSESVRTGQSVVPGREGSELFNTTLGNISGIALDSVNEGANAVLGAVGINPNVLTQAGGFSPDTANRAYAQARSIFESVKQGNFELSDIPNVFSDLQNLEILARSIFVPKTDTAGGAQSREKELCHAAPYATDLIAFAPKFKFLFVIEFVFHEAYNNFDRVGRDLAFVVKTSTRPDVQFEYEDVNMYNFWTKVPKRTIYQPMQMHFYDDNQNNANLFVTQYLRAMSPISNIKFDTKTQGVGSYEAASMNYPPTVTGRAGDQNVPLRNFSASLGPLNNNAKSVLSEIRLFHIYDYGRLMNVYYFYNPRITQFMNDDLTMQESGEGSDMGFEFAYDGMYITPTFDMRAGGEHDITELTNHGIYPIAPVYGDNGTSGVKNAPTEQSAGAGVDGVAGELVSAVNGLRESATGIVSNAFTALAGSGSQFINQV